MQAAVCAALAVAASLSVPAFAAEHPLQNIRIKGVAIGSPPGETDFQVIVRNDADLAKVIGEIAASPIRDRVIAISFFMNYNGRNASPRGALNLAGIERLPALRTVGLGSISVIGWEHLATRPLKKLVLSGIPNADISIIGKLTKLEELELGDVGPVDLASLRKLVALRKLKLVGEAVRDIASLSTLPHLEELEVLHLRSHLSSYEAIAALKNLKTFRMMYGGPADLAPLARLTKLSNLDMQEPAVTNFGPIGDMRALKQLRLITDRYRRGVPDVSFLRKSTQLEEIQVSVLTAGFDMNWFTNYPKLRVLTLFFEPTWPDVGALRSLGTLEELSLVTMDTHPADLQAIGSLNKLKKLRVGRAKMPNWNFVRGLTALTELDLGYSPTDTIDFVAPLKNLTALNVEHTSVSDLTPLSGLTKLERLNIDFTRVRNVDVLENLPVLKSLKLYGAPIKDYSPLERRPDVKWYKKPPTGDALEALFADQTVHKVSPVFGNQIEYMNTDGDVFKWSASDPKIVHGEWELRGDKKVCFRYESTPSEPNNEWDCTETSTWYHFNDIRKRWSGDAFGLSKRDTAPGDLSPWGDIPAPR